MKKESKLNLIGSLLLLIATLSWGSSFLILKNTMDKAPGFFIIAVRFIFVGIVLALVFVKRLIKIDKSTIRYGIILGVVVGMAYFTQTWGLKNTTPSSNAFLTATYCIMCPFLYWLMFKKKPKSYHLIAAVMCLVGIALISFFSGQETSAKNKLLGDGLTLCSAVFFSLQIIVIDKSQEHSKDPIVLVILQSLMVGLILLVCYFIFEFPKGGIEQLKEIGRPQWTSIAYLTIVCTLLTQFEQIFGQKFVPANQSALILSLEAVFGMMFSVIFGSEKLTVALIIGFALTFGAVLIGELKISPFEKIIAKRKNNGCSGNK